MFKIIKKYFVEKNIKDILSRKEIITVLLYTLILIILLIAVTIFMYFSNGVKENLVYKVFSIIFYSAFGIYFIFYLLMMIRKILVIKKRLSFNFEKTTFFLLAFTSLYSLGHSLYSFVIASLNNSLWNLLFGYGYFLFFIMRTYLFVRYLSLMFINYSKKEKEIISNRTMLIVGIISLILSFYVIAPLINIYQKGDVEDITLNYHKSSLVISSVSFFFYLINGIVGFKRAQKYESNLLSCVKVISLWVALLSFFNFAITISPFVNIKLTNLLNFCSSIAGGVSFSLSLFLLINSIKSLHQDKRVILLTKRLKIKR